MKKRLLCFMLSALFCFSAAAPVNAASSDAEKREPVAAYAQEGTDTLISNMTDIDADAYYADAVEWALENGVTKGTTATTFSPDDTCTRGQVVTFLWRAEGSPEPSSLENPFEDVAESAYFYKAVLWAVEQGITNGTSETAFSPYQKCSQAHILTFIWRENGEPSASSGGVIASAFRSHWAYRAVSWAESDRLIDNATASSFNPASDCPRADVMLYLYRNIWESAEGESVVFSSYTAVTFTETVYEATDAADFTSAALSLISQYENIVSTNSAQSEYASARIVVSANEKLPDFQEYNVAQVVCDASGNYLIQFNDASDAESCAKYLNSLPSVEYAEPDAIITVDPIQHNANASTDSYSWGVSAIHADQYASHIQTKGQNQTVIVAVVDTGVDSTHPFLRGRIVSGYDFIEKDNSPQDKNGHGTHVSGTVVDCTPGLNVKIMPVRVFEYRSGSAYVIAQGIRYAADHGANVINLSLGGPHSTFYEDAINYAVSKNITVVVSAGNDNSDTASYCPAHIERCITVSAVNQQKDKASFSNWGKAVDIAAPGVDIRSSVPDGKYAVYQGTSMAAPHVSAAAALLLYDQGKLQMPSTIEKKLKEAATAKTPAQYYGAGFLNLQSFIPSTEYVITLDPNGGTVNPDTLKIPVGDSYGVLLPTLSRTGYSFEGWYTAKEGGNLVTSSDRPSQNRTLYAHWIPDVSSVTVTFHANGGTLVGNRSKQVSKGQPYGELPTATLDGYRFGGWFTASYGGTEVKSETTVNQTESHTLYAHWTPEEGIVNFHGNGGTVIGDRSKQVMKGQPYGELPKATRDGYHFDGWFTESYGGTEVTPDTIVNQTASHMLHAHWTQENPPPDDKWCGEHVTWTLEDGVLTLSGTGTMYDYTNGAKPPWASVQDTIRSIRIESGVTSVGSSAFERCSNLVSIEFPNQFNSIGMSAFGRCSSLSTLVFSGNVNSVGMSAFEQCNSLASITISGNVNSIGMSAFEQCNSLTSVTISGNVNSIGMSAFESCSNLSSVTISGSVNSIGMSAFEDCSNLSNLTISTGVNSIGMSAFEDCSKLTDVYFSGTSAQWQRISIGMDAFPDSITIHYGNE